MALEPKSTNLVIRISPSELERIKDYAAKHGLKYSEFCLEAIRGAMGDTPYPSRDEFQELSERLAHLEKEIQYLKSPQQVA